MRTFAILLIAVLTAACSDLLGQPIAYYSYPADVCKFVEVPNKDTGKLEKIPCDQFSAEQLASFEKRWAR